MRTFDPRQYKFTEWSLTKNDGPFAFMQPQPILPRGVEEVAFDDFLLPKTDYEKNGVSFTFYGSGQVYEHAAMLLDDGNILFCIVNGTQFAGTFSSNDDIRMRYYMCTPIQQRVDKRKKK